MDNEFKWIAAIFAIIFGGLFFGIGFSDYTSHVERVECMKAHGEYIGKTCVFRAKGSPDSRVERGPQVKSQKPDFRVERAA